METTVNETTPAAGERDRPVAASGGVEMVRSEERLQVGTQREVTGRVRIGKRVVTEERVVTVTVRREELTVQELPEGVGSGQSLVVTHDSVAGLEDRPTGTAVVDMVLSEEEVEVVTRVVPRERVRVFVEAETEYHDVNETLAREVIEVDASEGTVSSTS